MVILRRSILTTIACAAVSPARAEALATQFTFEAIEGGTLDLATLRGRAMLVVNTASFCAFTRQYKGLEALHAARSTDGLTVVGVPSQDFNQEKDSNGEVKAFCESTFGVRFPMTGITKVTGPEAHPFYRWVKQTRDWEPSWNFCKVLIGRDGRIAGLYASRDEPGGPRLSADINAALSATA